VALSIFFYRVIFMKTVLSFISIFMLMITINQTQAHNLKENSAQIIMRDGQIEIRLSVNMARWQSLLQNNQAWLLGDIPQVMPKHLTKAQQGVFLSELISNNTQVSINDRALKMGILYFPELTPIKNKSENKSENESESKNESKDDHHHDKYSEIVLTAQHQQGHVNHISLALPKSLGNVHSRFVQPSYRLIKAGSKTQLSFKRHLMANTNP